MTPEIRIGISLPAPAAADPLGSWTAALRASADAGLDHVMVGDHISFHVGFGMDGLTLAAMVLAVEPRLAVDIGIYLLGLRHPVRPRGRSRPLPNWPPAG